MRYKIKEIEEIKVYGKPTSTEDVQLLKIFKKNDFE